MTTFSDITPNCPANRWAGTKRCYTPEDVLKLRGSVLIEHTLAKLGSAKLWKLLHEEKYVHSLGALTGNQAMQMVRAGLKAIYLSGWQVAADNNTSGMMYPDQSIYPVNSGPELCRRINNTLIRADQIEYAEGAVKRDWLAPIIADAEAGFGGAVNCFEIVKAYIQAGVSAVHFEDQLSSEKKCGHLGGKVLIPTRTFLRSLSAARLAADVCGVATLIIARTDAQSAQMITSDVDPEDEEFIDRDDGVTAEGFHRLKKNTGLQHCIKRGLASAPYADLLWWETSTPNLQDAKIFADAIHEKFPGKMLAYNCSPSFNWEKNLDTEDIATFQQQLADMGYKYQFITLAGFHCLNYGMYELASSYKTKGMSAFADLQRKEFAAVEQGFTAVRHQREVGTGYFDKVALTASGNQTSTTALKGSTETDQFYKSQKSADASVAYLNGVHAENGDSVNGAH